MHKAGSPGFIHQYLGWHAPHLEEVDFLPVEFENTCPGIRKPDEWQIVGSPVILESLTALGSDNNYGRGSINEFLMVETQLRHMPLAEWSGKAAVKDQENIRFCLVIGEFYSFTVKILQRKIRRFGIQFNFWHTTPYSLFIKLMIL